MKPKTKKQSWSGSVKDWSALLLISLGIIVGSSLILGPILSDTNFVSQKIVAPYHCPGAINSTEERGPITQVGSDPNSFGQTVRIVCTFADGSTKVIGNDENAVSAIVGSIILGAVIGVVIVVIFIPLYIVWKRNPRRRQKQSKQD
ncbi:MAG: hypothetical protein IT314_04950 [Anaerolineales bacterium]|nr:hypothetical protein [Anaerolineales bacterium]